MGKGYSAADTLAILTTTYDTLTMDTAVRHNLNIVFTCHYHVVFCPEYRRKVLVNGIDERLKPVLLETVQKWGQDLISVEVLPDHVHLLLSCDPQFGIHRLIKYLKGNLIALLASSIPCSQNAVTVFVDKQLLLRNHGRRDLRSGQEIRRESER